MRGKRRLRRPRADRVAPHQTPDAPRGPSGRKTDAKPRRAGPMRDRLCTRPPERLYRPHDRASSHLASRAAAGPAGGTRRAARARRASRARRPRGRGLCRGRAHPHRPHPRGALRAVAVRGRETEGRGRGDRGAGARHRALHPRAQGGRALRGPDGADGGDVVGGADRRRPRPARGCADPRHRRSSRHQRPRPRCRTLSTSSRPSPKLHKSCRIRSTTKS